MECYPFSSGIFAHDLVVSAGNWRGAVEWVSKAIEQLPAIGTAYALQRDAVTSPIPKDSLFCTDPPYYDNISYADLSDFFYVWERHSLQHIYPDLFSTLLVPKAQELVATPFKFDGDEEKARGFFEDGFVRAFTSMRAAQHSGYPLSIYYAFKQAEADDDEQEGQASTGWETMLEGLMKSALQITGTWPMHTERAGGFRNKDRNALASSIILVCRPRSELSGITSRKDFLTDLKCELPGALRDFQKGNIAPVDLAQAAIGPGMAVFSRYSKVIEADGSPMTVRTALALINQTLNEVLAEQEGEFDADTRWALAWFEQHGFDDGLFGEAETLSRTSSGRGRF